MVAKPSGHKTNTVCFGYSRQVVAKCNTQPLALAVALPLATGTPLTEAGRKTQRALYCILTSGIPTTYR